MIGLNKVFLLGRIAERGVTVSQVPDTGTLVAAFALGCDELGQDGHTYTSWFLVEGYGKAREQVEPLAAGTLVCVEGKLRKKKRMTKGEERWETIVQAWTVHPVLHPAAVLAQEG